MILILVFTFVLVRLFFIYYGDKRNSIRSQGQEERVTDVNVTLKYVESDAVDGDNACEPAEQPRKLSMQVKLDDPLSPTACPLSPTNLPGLISLHLDILSPCSIVANVLEQKFFPPDVIPTFHQPQERGHHHHHQQQQQQQKTKPVANQNKKKGPIITNEPANKAALEVLKQIRRKKRPSEVLREVRAVTQEVISFRREVREATKKYRSLNRHQSSLKVPT